MFWGSRGARAIGALGLGVAAIALLAACDDFRDVEVTNGCDDAIEVANSHVNSGYGIFAVDPGDTVTANSSGGPFDIVVRAQGSSDWETRIYWDEMTKKDDEYLRTYTVEGDKCPTQQG